MKKDAKILFVYPNDNEEAKTFAQSLRSGFPDLNISLTGAKLPSLLFDVRKVDLVHFFFPATVKPAQFLKKLSGNARFVQTMLSSPDDPEDYRNLIFGDQLVVFSENQKSIIKRYLSTLNVEVIPPCVALPDHTRMAPNSSIRQKYDATEHFLVLSLNDFSTQEQFNTFLYISRELNRRESFRFVIPFFQNDRNATMWRNRLKYSIEQEGLTSVRLLDGDEDLHALIDSCDSAMFVGKQKNRDFEFPLTIVEALLAGKPVLAFDKPPANELLAGFNPSWTPANNEDFVRETRDLYKESPRLEQIATELARYAKSRVSVKKVAESYLSIYEKLTDATASTRVAQH